MVIRRKLHDETGRSAYWAAQPVRKRIAALETIRGTTNDAVHVQKPFPKSARKFSEHFGPQKTAGRHFDLAFWQAQGPAAIFAAATDLIQDYFLLHHGHADLPRLQRTIESFHRK
jgi:hypothetical protein